MAKTVFSSGVRAPAAFWTAINNHRHSGIDADGENALPYAEDTGSVNAVVLTLTPALTTYAVGMPIYFKATNTNTDSTIININGLGSKNITRNNGSALSPGNLIAGAIYKVVYNSTAFVLMNSSNVT